MKNISVIGIGMGNPDTITIEGQKHIDKAEVLIGAKRMVEAFENKSKTTFISYDSSTIAEYISNTHYDNYAVLLSGDTGFYSGANKLMPLLKSHTTKVIAGISSLSYFCAKLGCSWENIYTLSLHGRNENIVLAAKEHEKVFALTDGKISSICSKLTQAGLGDVEVCVGENLSYNNERIIRAKAETLTHQDFESVSVILIHNPSFEMKLSIGLPDEAFIRAEVPMTKSEVRAIAISKLCLKNNAVVYDIGAGTGSVAIEAALIAKEGKVYAIEQNEQAIALIQKNKEKFSVDNLEIIHALAPEGLEQLPKPDVVFIGGSKGNIEAIVESVLNKNNQAKVVVSAITLETLNNTINVFNAKQLEKVEVVQASISKTKKVGTYNMLLGQNPVFIISATGKEKTN